MIMEMKGNLLGMVSDVIAHQVNCKGVMGAGVAKQIKNKMLPQRAFMQYQRLCEERGASNLGNVLYSPAGEQIVANLFAENIPTGKGLDTDYEALYRCLLNLRDFCERNHYTAAIPGYLGCGLAGGDWNHVYNTIIYPLFASSPVDLTIVYLEDGVCRLWDEFLNAADAAGTDRLETVWHGFAMGTQLTTVSAWFYNTFRTKESKRYSMASPLFSAAAHMYRFLDEFDPYHVQDCEDPRADSVYEIFGDLHKAQTVLSYISAMEALITELETEEETRRCQELISELRSVYDLRKERI